jgi:YVTN family beta-propeller protein
MKIVAAVPLFLAVVAFGQTPDKPVRAVTDPGVVTTRQAITPAGVPTVFQGRVYGVAFGANASELWVLYATQVYRLDWNQNRVLDNVPLNGTPGLQGIRFDAAGGAPLFAFSSKGRKVELGAISNGRAGSVAGSLGDTIAGALAVAEKPNAKGQRIAAVPLIAQNKLAVVDLGSRTLLGAVSTAGIAPFGVAMNRDGSVAYVSNWGGRVPKSGDLSAPAGLAANADRVAVDVRGVASSGTVARLDLTSMTVTHTIPVELHPTAILWDEPRHRLYVANGNKDSVSVIDTEVNRVIRTVRLQPFHRVVAGIAPTALALSPDGTKLYVSCGGINAVAQVNTADGVLEGMIPTAWYPTSLSISSDGKLLAVGALLGAGSGWREQTSKRFVHAYRGAVSVVSLPDRAQLIDYTNAVTENNRMRLAGSAADPEPKAAHEPIPIPRRAGDPSLIDHVVYIVKENRTYDQVLGDVAKGNGDPSLVMFGREVTPNHHRLAEQFVLLDNFYATGGNSADGHQWLTQANEVDYCLWPGYAGRSYPFDGSDPIAYSGGGFLWDLAIKKKQSVRIYGEYAGRSSEQRALRLELLKQWQAGESFLTRWNITAPVASVDAVLARNYPAYSTSIPDVIRARIFLQDLKGWEASGKMPSLTIIQLPSDHTFGTTPGASSPKAMVADNDYALGQIVDGLTHSRFWKKMAIFVVEDDAQNGVDHVDGHRTVALAISPYVRRGAVDSTFYAHQSILKTIELILGLPTLSLFDLIASDMRASFSNTADGSPYSVVIPKQSLSEINPPASALRGPARSGALAAAKMRWDVPDAVPSDRLNRILWHSIRGWDTPYPGARQAVFSPLSLDTDEDEIERASRPPKAAKIKINR